MIVTIEIDADFDHQVENALSTLLGKWREGQRIGEWEETIDKRKVNFELNTDFQHYPLCQSCFGRKAEYIYSDSQYCGQCDPHQE